MTDRLTRAQEAQVLRMLADVMEGAERHYANTGKGSSAYFRDEAARREAEANDPITPELIHRTLVDLGWRKPDAPSSADASRIWRETSAAPRPKTALVDGKPAVVENRAPPPTAPKEYVDAEMHDRLTDALLGSGEVLHEGKFIPGAEYVAKRDAPPMTAPDHGPNGVFFEADRALRFLAENKRPDGGNERYNTEHLYMIADELNAAIEALRTQRDNAALGWANATRRAEAAEARLREVAKEAAQAGIRAEASEAREAALRGALEGLLDAVNAHNKANGKQMIDPHAEQNARTALARMAGPGEVVVKLPLIYEETTLAECPVGLFFFGDELCFKSEYGDNSGRIDAYIVSSGEFFWGGSSQTIASQRASRVRPVDHIHLLSAARANNGGNDDQV